MIIIKERDYPFEYADDYVENEAIHIYGYKIYNYMTSGNTFVMSADKKLAEEYGKWLVDIYKNYDEDTIGDDLDEFFKQASRTTPETIITNPEYWYDERINRDLYTVFEYDNSDIVYGVEIVGSWSSRF
jgi:ATP-dependent RNA circularization protein (DNA/RNA ligase family)